MADPVRLGRYAVRTYANALDYGSHFVTRKWRQTPEDKRASLAVHFDIDFTLLNEDAPFVVDGEEYLMPIKEIVQLLLHCKRVGYLIIIITARSKKWDKQTRANLALFQIPFDTLIFSSRKAQWKRALRDKMGIRFVMSLGDSLIDVLGGPETSGEPVLLRTPGVTSFR